MKLGFKFNTPAWPWWNGFWTGLAAGIYLLAWIGKLSWNTPTAWPTIWILPVACLFLSWLPEAVIDLSAQVRRYRSAAKRTHET